MSSRKGSTGPQQSGRHFQRGGLRDSNNTNDSRGEGRSWNSSAQQQQQQPSTSSQSRSTRNNYNSNRGKHSQNNYHHQNNNQQQQQQDVSDESRNLHQLRRILNEEEDLARRNAGAVQLLKSIEEVRQKGDPAQTQNECLQLLDACLFKQQQNVRSIFENMRPHSNTLKNSTMKLLSILGCYCGRLDIVLLWIFEHLQRWPSATDISVGEANRIKEFKLWLLRLLRQAIADASSDPYIKCQLYDISSNIMNSMIMFLDAMYSPDYLPEVLHVLDILAASCPTTFSEKFQDIIDLLVGWHIDTNVSEYRRSLICETYKNFRPFWQTRLSFAFELLQHFLNDMQGIISSIMTTEGDTEIWKSKWETCESLFSCFHAMIQAIVPLLVTSEVQKDTHIIGPIFDLLRPNVLSFLCHVKEISPSDAWMEKSNQVLFLLFSTNPQGVRLYQRQVYDYFASQMKGRSSGINPHTYLKTLMKLIDAWGSDIDESIVQCLLDIEYSPLFHLRGLNRGDKQLNSGILVMLRSLIRLSFTMHHVQQNTSDAFAKHLTENLTVITDVYSIAVVEKGCILRRTEQEIHKNPELLSKYASRATSFIEKKSSWSQVTDAVVDALFISYLLLDAGTVWPNYKTHNLLLVLDTLHTAWRCKCSDVFDACIQVLTEFCSSCLYLLDDVANFHLLSNLFQDLCDNWGVLNLSSRQIICKYIKDVLYTITSSDTKSDKISDILPCVVKTLLEAIKYERNNFLKEDMLKVGTYFCQHYNSTKLTKSALACIQNGLDDPHSSIRTASSELLSVLNPFLIADIDIGNASAIKFLETIVMATPHTGAFRPTHYEITMASLGMSEHLVGSHAENAVKALQNHIDGDQMAWARRLFHHCGSLASIKNVNIFKESKQDARIARYVNNSREFLKYWVIWEASRYCMLSRLRTPLGGPQQTLAAFERMLASLLTVSADQLRDDSMIRDNLSSLLLLLDRLEIQIYNASNGCATNALPSVPRSSLVFFRTNKKTCKEYFARIRPAIIQGAKMLHDDSLLIRNTLELLHEREIVLHDRDSIDPLVWFNEINGLLRDLVQACIKMTASDLIHGIQAWYRRIIRRVTMIQPSFQQEWFFNGLIGPISAQETCTEPLCSATWFQVAAQFALGHHENAIQLLDTLHNHIVRDEYGIMDMLDNEALDFYTCIEDYTSLKQLYDVNGSLFTNIFSRELMMFSDDNNPEEIQPTCDLNDFYSSLCDLNITESIQLGRLLRFRDWLGQGEPMDHIQAKINHTLSDRARLSLEEDVLSQRSSMIEMQLLQSSPRKIFNSINDYAALAEKSSSADGKNILETVHWGRLCNYVEYTCDTFLGKDEPDYSTSNNDLAFIRLRSARVARRQGNLEIANSWLEAIPSTVLYQQFPVLYEKAKVLLLQPDSLSQLTAMETLNEIIVGMEEGVGDAFTKKLHSKACLEAARLLKNSYNDNGDTKTLLLDKLDSTLVNAEGMDSMYKLQSPVEIAIDTLLKKSVKVSKLIRKPWFEYATYHYKQGWRILDELTRNEPSIPIVLWARQQLRDILGVGQHSEEPITIEVNLCGLLQKHSGSVGVKSLVDHTILKNAVQKALSSSNDDQIYQILKIMEIVNNNIIETFQISSSAYFQYLSLGETNSSEASVNEKRSTSMVMTATLRLLRMLVKYSDVLQSIFCEKIEHVSIEPWKKIIPQLFARLNHPSNVVQKVISQLLRRICDEYPREIIYDIIVSSSSSKTNHESKTLLSTIANRMMERNETLWLSTQRMAEELEKITVLWEEEWSYKISSLALNAIELFTKLDQEVVRLESNHHKEIMTQEQIEKTFFESYDNVMKFIISSVDKLLQVTILTTESKTPHEQWFVDTFGKRIIQAFEVLQKPKSIATFRNGWDMFIQVNRNLVFETHKMRVLELEHVSPYLASLRNSTIGIPGMYNNDNSPVYIDSFGSNVVILPTKTKPKKLDMRGSDGKKYSYLFKGLEDLHLDERIMQLLNTVNGLLKEDKTAVARDLKTRTYAVIPVSDHSGMIQWVNDATPLFALYKRWQRREQSAKLLLSGDKVTSEDLNQPLQRPTELFANKIEAALKAEGLRVTTNRRNWPKHILKKVFLELVKETPNDLLAKEIWCSSSDAAGWLQKSTSLNRSLAVMSVIGYIIGLGDRHLDNILIDYQSGEVIHIDYNVCFEKGRQLRVPELVPFRLTQNLFNALGVTGTDGVFRTAAEETLRVLRKHKEVLMTLLDAFIYDPLVHWATEAEELEERQVMELQINLGLVAKRLGEKRSDYEKRQHDVTKALSAVTDKLQHTQQKSLQELQQQAIDDGSDDEVEDESFVDQAKKNIHLFVQECSKWAHKHGSTLVSLTKNTFVETLLKESYLSTEMFKSIESNAGEDFEEFLQTLLSWITQKNAVYHRCFEEIRTYKSLMQPVARKLLLQDCCSIWPALQELIEQSFAKNKAEEVWERIQHAHFSQFMQNLESTAFNYANIIAQALARIDEATRQFNLYPVQDLSKLQAEVHTLTRQNPRVITNELVDSLMVIETAFRRLESDDQEYTTTNTTTTVGVNAVSAAAVTATGGMESSQQLDLIPVLPTELQTLEQHCHIGPFGHVAYINGLLGLTIYLQCYVDVFRGLGEQFDTAEFNALKGFVPCAKSIYVIEDGCFSVCNTIFEGLIEDGQRTKSQMIELQNFFNTATIDILIGGGKQYSTANPIYQLVQKPFENLDRFYNMAKVVVSEMGLSGVDSAVETYARLKKRLIMCLMKECLKHIESVPQEGWTTSLISTWGVTCSTVIGQQIKVFTTVYVSSIFIPFVTTLIQGLRQRLPDTADQSQPTITESKTSHDSFLRQLCGTAAKNCILETVKSRKAKYVSGLQKYEADITRFHWYNAPYIQTRRPLLPEPLVARMADGPERLHGIGNTLHVLNDMYKNLIKHIPQLSSTQNVWQSVYHNELKKCTTIMDIYETINHMESCREGFTQAMIIGKEIGDNLEPFMVGEISDGPTNNVDDNSIYVSPDILREVRKELHNIYKTICVIRSPVDGVVSLLESIAVIDVDIENDLSPAQHSAKAVLDSLSSIHSTITKLNAVAEDWTYSHLNESIQTFNVKIRDLFAALRTLEEFGADRPDEPREQQLSLSTTTTTTTTIAHDTSADVDNFPEQSSSPLQVLEDRSKEFVGQTKQVVQSSSQDQQNAHGGQQQQQQQQQRRDTQVLNIMRRIRSKLEGRDFGSQHKMSVSEQVTKVVDQSISVDNLCAMYEGWTSWI